MTPECGAPGSAAVESRTVRIPAVFAGHDSAANEEAPRSVQTAAGSETRQKSRTRKLSRKRTYKTKNLRARFSRLVIPTAGSPKTPLSRTDRASN